MLVVFFCQAAAPPDIFTYPHTLSLHSAHPVSARGVVPTERADQLDPLVRDLITRLHRLGEPVAFDPTTSERTFRLALYENPAVMLIPDLVRRLQSTGSNIRIAVVAPDRERMSEGMEDGSIDMFVGSGGRTSSLWPSRTLLEEH